MTNKPPAEIQTGLRSTSKVLTPRILSFSLEVFSDSVVIIDGIAPYRWLNPDAPAKWLADVEKWRADLGVTYEHLSYEMGFWNVEGPYAYAVIAGTLTVTIKGQPPPGTALWPIRSRSMARDGRSTLKPGGDNINPYPGLLGHGGDW